MNATPNPSWLDALARRAARGEVAPVDSVPASPAAARAGGLSRRAMLRAAAAVVVLSGSARLATPSAARAQAGRCLDNSFELAQQGFAACARQPVENFNNATRLLEITGQQLQSTRSKAARKTYKRRLASYTRDQAKAARALEQCAFEYVRTRKQLAFDCTFLGGSGPNCPDGRRPCAGTCCAAGDKCCECGICCVLANCACCP